MEIKSLKPQKGKFKQGYYKPVNSYKYQGSLSEIIYRSSYEYLFMQFCDYSPTVVRWASESTAIPYISPVDNKEHRYYVDFWVLMKDNNGNTQQYYIEIKPNYQLKKPSFDGNKTTKKIAIYESQMKTYMVNEAKFKTAKNWAEKQGKRFIVITEDWLKEAKKQLIVGK